MIIDPDHGADILSLVDRRTGIDVLFKSPWEPRAKAICAGQRTSLSDPVGLWLEQYRGGWQTLCPNAGSPRSIYGAQVGFHGEASVVPWSIDEVDVTRALLHVELFSVPVVIHRMVTVNGSSIELRDILSNLSDVALGIDYVSHPALGGTLLEGACRIKAGATRFTSDPDSHGWIEPGREYAWPWAIDGSGERIDLRELPPGSGSRALFGWLHEFSEYCVSVENDNLGIRVRVEWDGSVLPYAWVWQELNATDCFPWYRRARVIAIEPASTETSGDFKKSVLRLPGKGRVEVGVNITLERGRSGG